VEIMDNASALLLNRRKSRRSIFMGDY